MEYIHLTDRSGIDTLYREIKYNIIRVINKYCRMQYNDKNETALGLVHMLFEADENLSSIIEIAEVVAGSFEASDDVSEEFLRNFLAELTIELEEEMKKLS